MCPSCIKETSSFRFNEFLSIKRIFLIHFYLQDFDNKMTFIAAQGKIHYDKLNTTVHLKGNKCRG